MRRRPVDESTLLTEDGSLPAPYSTTEISVNDSEQQESLDLPEASGVPGGGDDSLEPELMSKCAIVLLNISFLGINLMFLILSVIIIPAQVEALVGSSSKGSVLGGIVAAGAVITFIVGPLMGMGSDRLNTRYGRRRPLMVLSCIILCVGLIGLALSAPKVNLITPTPNNSTNDTETCHQNLMVKRCLPYYSNQSDLLNILGEISPRSLGLPHPSAFEGKTIGKLDAGNLGFFIIFYFVVITSYVCLTTPYNALVADKSHYLQRGLSSGVMGGMILTGNIGGAALGLLIKPIGIVGVYIITIVILCSCVFVTVISNPEKPNKLMQVPLTCKQAVVGFWLPLKDSDFRWVFITRFLMQQGLTTTVGFLEYWLGDMVDLPNCWNAYRGLSIILIPLLVSAAASSVISGIVSDKIGKRKPLIIAASLTMATVTGLLAILSGAYAYYITAVASVFFGMAFGGYQAVDFALLMDVLPNPEEKSRDIAVWQQALILPQALAVPIAGVIIDIFERVNCRIGLGYIIAWCVTSAYFILSGIFVLKIRKVQ